MKTFLSFGLTLVGMFSSVFAENVFDDSLYTPVVPEYRSLADLKWKLPQGASMSNGWLVVEQKPGPMSSAARNRIQTHVFVEL